ncbi:MAG: hypothetical protein WCO57_16890 [Verrucomicrobiota bacterium]
MKSASQLWKIPLAVIRAAAAGGCLAFKNHRVSRPVLVDWLKTHPEIFASVAAAANCHEQTRILRCQKLQLETEGLEFQLEIAKGLLMPKTAAEELWATCIGIVTEEAKMMLEREAYRVFIERIKGRLSQIIAGATVATVA